MRFAITRLLALAVLLLAVPVHAEIYGNGWNATSIQPGFNFPGPVQNITQYPYYAVSSTAQVSCTASVLNPSVSCTGAGDFQAGQPITFNHAGNSVAVLAPTPTITSSKWATPAVNTDTADGTGAANATYLIGALDGAGGVQMGGAAVSISNSQAALSFNAFNKVAFAPATGGFGTVICGCVGTACVPVLEAVVPQGQSFYYDMGSAAGTHFGTTFDSSTICLPGTSLNDNWNTTVATVLNGVPTSLTTAPQNSVTNQPLFHDNSVAINAAEAAACTTGGTVYVPTGTYTLGQTPIFSNCKGVQFVGSGANLVRGSVLEWWGPLGGVAYKAYCIADSKFSDFTIDDAGGSTPSYGLQSSNVGCSLNNNTNLDFQDISIGESAYGIFISDTVNNSPLSFRLIKFLNGGIANVTISNAQSKNNQWWGTQEARRLYGTYCTTCGDQYFYGKQGQGWILDWLGTTANFTEFGGESEPVSRYLVTVGPSAAAGTVAFYGSHLQISPSFLPSDGTIFSYNLGSALLLDSVNFIGAGGTPLTAFGIQARRAVTGNGAAAVISRNNAYPNMTPFQYVSTGNSVVSIGDTGNGGAGNIALQNIFGVPSYYNAAATGGATALPACSALYARSYYCVSDETSACTAGNTYASGGTNKCQLQCNTAGTLWKVTGQVCY